MKKYRVNVNGTVYEVEIELIDANAVQSAPVAAPAAPVKEETPASAPAASVAEGGTTISAPMPGTILKVNVTAGQTVKKGDVLMILEAMKMENEIMAPADGTVASVSVNSGASVDSGTVLCTIA